MSNLKMRFKEEVAFSKKLFKQIPSLTVSLFFISIVCANLMANKELFCYKYIALDCGTVFSWIMFLCMDVICRYFGAKASIKVSMYALVVNLATCGIFALLSFAPGKWAEYYSSTAADEVNRALNATFSGSWYVVVGSSLAFAVSSVVNALLNAAIGKCVKNKNFLDFALRSYVSTFIAQLVDNFIFTIFVSKVFFGWTWLQVSVCAIVQAVFELLCEVAFSPLGYKVVKEWEANGVGK